MTPGIVDRLRYMARERSPDGVTIYDEAADEIERLRAELGVTEEARAAAIAQIHDMCMSPEEVMEWLDGWRERGADPPEEAG